MAITQLVIHNIGKYISQYGQTSHHGRYSTSFMLNDYNIFSAVIGKILFGIWMHVRYVYSYPGLDISRGTLQEYLVGVDIYKKMACTIRGRRPT